MPKKRTVRGHASINRRRDPIWVVALLAVMLLAIAAVIGSFGISWFRSSLAAPGILPGGASSEGPSENVDYGFAQLLPTWVGQDRVTVLLLGIDERAQEQGPWRTDTMMLLTLDPTTLQAGVLSIPRDLWVPIPGYKDGRVNTAHFLGDLYNYTGGGPALAVETVEYNLGVPIDYYVRINFQAFVTLVDQIGGIDIYVETAIDDPLYPDHQYGYDPLYIEAGWHHFNGEMALKYARTRHGSNDFDRADRQQQVMMAILERVSSLELLPDLARNAPQLLKTLESSISTDFALDQIIALGKLALDVDREQIRQDVLDQTCTQPWVTPDGAQVLIPVRERMREVRDYVFAVDLVVNSGTPTGAQDLLPTPTPEVASVAVLNGTARAGLAGHTAELLEAQGVDVSHVANAERQDVSISIVLVNRDKPVTLGRVLKILGMDSTVVVAGNDPNAEYDLVVILGLDFILPEG